MRRLVVIASIAVAAMATVLLVGQLREDFAERCTESWDAAMTVDVSRVTLAPEDVGRVSPRRNVAIGGRPFEVEAYVYKSMGNTSAPVNPLHRQRISVIFQVIAPD